MSKVLTTLLYLGALCNVVHSHLADDVPAIYVADIQPMRDSGVTGSVVVFAPKEGTFIAYAGTSMGLEAGLGAEECTAENGCGVHIHSGRSCFNNTQQAGHFFRDPVTEDPWKDDRYTSDSTGKGTFSGIVDVGEGDIKGRAFVVHAQNGTRVACGLLKPYADVEGVEVYESDTEELTGSGVSSDVYLITGVGGKADNICFFGEAEGLEADLQSQLFVPPGNVAESRQPSDDCTAKNGCGAHVHGGMDCTDSDTQGGHYYNEDALAEDPWALIGYETTDAEGEAYFVHCVETGETEFEGRLFIVHANDGSRVSCGPIESLDHDSEDSEDSPQSGASSAFFSTGLGFVAVVGAFASLFV